MKFEVLKRNNLKRNIVIGGCVVLIISAVILNFSSARYRSTASVPIVNSTVNYKVYDLKVLAMYQENEAGEYVSIDVMPSSGYVINESESYCTVDGINKDNNSRLYTNDNGEHVIANLQKKSKCYLYFDKYILSLKDTLLSYYPTVLTRTDFSTTVTTTTTGTIYKSADSTQYDEDGEVYYFAGNPTDNYVSFAGFYWRIIRVNGDGSIRIIYQGTSADATGIDACIGESVFNTEKHFSYYVGLSYDGTQHGTGTPSIVLTEINEWYDLNISKYKTYLDNSVGFCSDRNTTNGTWSATPSSTINYLAQERLNYNKKPSVNCSSEDILEIPIGLITADEASFAGGVLSVDNSNYYLNVGYDYWTMTPRLYSYGNQFAFEYILSSTGGISSDLIQYSLGIRPVINLRADVTVSSGNGTSTQPFVIS